MNDPGIAHAVPGPARGSASGDPAARLPVSPGVLFLMSTGAEILPVIAADGLPVGDGTAGPVTRQLRDAYAAAVSQPPTGTPAG
jgi:hypothetical protein